MAKGGWDVTVLEKHGSPGGRARQLEAAGFKFDMGPSWYWMHDVFERYFASFGKKSTDYYSLKRLDPSYRIYWNEGFTDIPANLHTYFINAPGGFYVFKKDFWHPFQVFYEFKNPCHLFAGLRT